MADPVTEAHIEAQARLRTLVVQGLAQAWRSLPGYGEEDVGPFLALVLPLILAAQRASVGLADAYVARVLGRRPLGVDPVPVIRGVRGPVEPREVYRRPFVQIWTALGDGTSWQSAVDAGRARAESAAEMDVQLAHFHALQVIQEVDPVVKGWRRAADPGACSFCRLVDGAKVFRADASPLHNRCGCALVPVTGEVVQPDPLPDGVAVHRHGELGPVLRDPAHDFTSAADLPIR